MVLKSNTPEPWVDHMEYSLTEKLPWDP
jgi:hypothetical protein